MANAAAPRTVVPPDACDAHLHVYDDRFASTDGSKFPHGTVQDYAQVQRHLGTSRAVPVQAKLYGTDNACLLDALAQLGPRGRGIAVVTPEVTDAELHRLHAGHVRGVRFSLWNPNDAVTSVDMIAPLAPRLADLGWHAQMHMSGDQVAAHATLLKSLPCTLVFDHMGRLPPGTGARHPAFGVIVDLVQRGRAWVKLSGAYLNTTSGPPYADATATAQAYVRAAPERLVWGSDWPHPTEAHTPDDAELLDLLTVWAPDTGVRNRILVDNPAKLYGFA
jgi:predicted TIM-barrel fold metal-dependent hydrolase